MLIDDNEADNYLHKLVIEELDCAKKVSVAYDGEEAIEFLTTPDQATGNLPIPDIIFLDINMPRMNGWEFLEAYKDQIPEEKRCKALVMMLTTSLNPDDKKQAAGSPSVIQFMNKPLTVDQLTEVLKENFPDCFSSTEVKN